jgi:hypothetical protein
VHIEHCIAKLHFTVISRQLPQGEGNIPVMSRNPARIDGQSPCSIVKQNRRTFTSFPDWQTSELRKPLEKDRGVSSNG